MDNQNDTVANPDPQNQSPIFNQNSTKPSSRTCPRCHAVSYGFFCNQCGLNLNINETPKTQVIYNQQPYPNLNQQPISQTQQNYYGAQKPQYTPQFSPYFQYMAPPQKPKNNVWIIWLVAAGIFIVTMIACIFITFSVLGNVLDEEVPNYNDEGNNSQENPNYTPNGISRQELNQIEVGMSYALVSKIIGGDGVISDQGQTPQGVKYYIYTWMSENDASAFVHITFKDDKVADIVNQGV